MKTLIAIIFAILLSSTTFAQNYYSADVVKKANAGDSDAQNMLGYCYQFGDGVVQNYAEAFKWYQKSANQGNSLGQVNLGYCYFDGVGVQQDFAKAHDLFKSAAAQGEVSAFNAMGYCYYEGKGVELDYAIAVYYFQMAADKDEPLGLIQLGNCYNNGEGVERNLPKAFQLYEKAANLGDAQGQYMASSCYFRGDGVKKDIKKAFALMKQSAEQGYAPAQNEIGYYYLIGDGVKQDYNLAYKWLKAAADQEDPTAYGSLGEYYYIKNDYKNSALYYQKCLQANGLMAEEDYTRWKSVKKYLSEPDCINGVYTYPAAVIEGFVDYVNKMLAEKNLDFFDEAKKLLSYKDGSKIVVSRIDDAISKNITVERKIGGSNITPDTYLNYLYTKNKDNPLKLEILNIQGLDENIFSVKMKLSGLFAEPFVSKFFIVGNGIGYIYSDYQTEHK